jgi:zinc transport system permease protein
MSIDNQLIIIILTGIISSTILSAFGCIVVWRRVTYIGDAIAHASILGVVLSIWFSLNMQIALILTCFTFAILLYLSRHIKMSNLMTLIFSYTFLSAGMVLVSFLYYVNIDLMSFLFGDILIVNVNDLLIATIVGSIAFLWLLFRWKEIINMSVNEDLALVDGINVNRVSCEFFIIVSVLIGISIKIIGILMVSAMLIIPAVAAGYISKTPLAMVIKSIIISIIAVLIGLYLSYIFDSATGPSIVVSAAIIFFIISITIRLKNSYFRL